MLTKQQMRMLGTFAKNVLGRYTFKDIKQMSRQKSNSAVQDALREFRKQELVTVEKAGNVSLYSLNMKSNAALGYLALVNEEKLRENKNIPVRVLKKIDSELRHYTDFYIVLVFGSYAKGKQNAKSDLDVAVIVESDASKKEVIPYLATVKRRELLEVDYHVFTRAEFQEMLYIELPNVGKEIYLDNVIYYGAVQYYLLLDSVRGRITFKF